MASRRNIPPVHDDIMPTRGSKRSDPLHALLHPVEPLPFLISEEKLTSQAVEIDQLRGDNQILAFRHVSLRQDFAAAQQEVEKLREHIKSIQVEGDIQIRILLDKIAKKEENIRAGDRITEELEEAHLDAQTLAQSRQELTAQIQHASLELDEACDDIKKLPEMHSELENLRQEHQRLCKVFEHEKGANIEKVEEMKIMEKELIRMAEEVDRLRMEVSTAENKATGLLEYCAAPSVYGVSYVNTNYTYPDPIYGNGGYVGGYGIPPPQIAGVVVEGAEATAISGAQFSSYPSLVSYPHVDAAGFPIWSVAYDASNIHM